MFFVPLAIAAGAQVAGAGISAYGARQAGRAQQAVAELNAQQQMRNAQYELLAGQAQANLLKQQAQANFYLRSIEAQTMFNNALTITRKALSDDAINRTNIRRSRAAGREVQGRQRAAIAASGLAESGTPLDILAETAERIQQEQEASLYQNELNRRTLFREAAVQRYGGQVALAGATLDRSVANREADLRYAAAGARYQSSLRAAEITRLEGGYAAQAGRTAAMANLFNGLASAGSTAASF